MVDCVRSAMRGLAFFVRYEYCGTLSGPLSLYTYITVVDRAVLLDLHFCLFFQDCSLIIMCMHPTNSNLSIYKAFNLPTTKVVLNLTQCVREHRRSHNVSLNINYRSMSVSQSCFVSFSYNPYISYQISCIIIYILV